VDILGVYIPPGLDGAAMLKGFMAAAGDLDTGRKQRMFQALVGAAVIELEQRLSTMQLRLGAIKRDE
jgi:hypothetical protein